MAYRFSCKSAAIATGGTTYAHGLTRGGVATAPDEWFFNARDGTTTGLFLTATPGTTSMIVSTTAATGLVDIFAAIAHSILAP